MVKDENLRQVRTEAGKKGGNPALLNQSANQTPKQLPTPGVKQNPTPSISSSITASKKEREAANAAAPARPLKKKASASPSPRERGPGGEVAPRPTLAEVQAYAAEQHPASAGAQAEAAAFCDHYESNGWRVSGKTPMANWRAAFRNWMRRRAQFQAAAGGQSPAPPGPAPPPNPPTPPAGAELSACSALNELLERHAEYLVQEVLAYI